MNRANRVTHLSLRHILIASLISQVLLAVGLTAYFSWKNGRKTIESLAMKLSREVTSHTEKHITNYLNTPITFLKINQAFSDRQNLNLADFPNLQALFWQQAQINPEIHTIYFGSANGDFLEIEMKSVPKISIRDRTTAPYWHTYLLDEKGQITTFLEKRKYDPRQRPWYQSALQHQGLVWSPIYLFTDPPVLGITSALPLKDPQSQTIQGVMAIDLSLDDIGQFLNTLKIGDSGRVFVMEKTGKLIATSRNKSPIIDNGGAKERLHYLDSSDPLIKATAAFLAEQFNNFQQISHQQLIFEFNRDRHFVQATNLTGFPGLDWLMVTVIPEADFMEYIRRNTYMTLLLITVASIAAILLGAIANQLMVNSVTYLANVAKAIANGQIIAINQTPKIKELAVVTESINSMASQLQTSAQSVENLEAQLEQRVAETTKDLRQVNKELSRLASTDSLTQIYNRYYFDLALDSLWQDTIEERGAIALIICDVDNFKQYNDTYGHLMGDRCLKKVAEAINNSVNRNKDVAARYGGEEFAIILPRTKAQGAMEVANKIRNATLELNIPHQASDVSSYVTLSCGVACVIPTPNSSIDSLINNADNALYQAKRQGKNCTVLGQELT